MSIFSWKMSQRDLQKQLLNYDTLKITESYRGISALLIVASTALTIGAAVFHLFPSDAIYSAFVYLPLAFFIYRGHRWAMILMMVLWTFEKGYQLINTQGSAPIVPVIWWFIYMNYFVNSLRIELARRKPVIAA